MNREGAKDAKLKLMEQVQDPSQNLNCWLTRACAALIAIDLLHIPLGLASIPRYIQRVTTLTIPVYGTGIGNVLTNELVLAQASARGMTLPIFAWYLLSIQLFASLIFTMMGGLVLWRARDHWFGWFTVHVLLFLNSYAFYPPVQVAQLLPPAVIDLGSVFWPTFVIYFFLFPNGRSVPRWMRWPMVVYGLVHFALQLAGSLIAVGWLPVELFQFLLSPVQTFILGVFLMVLVCQIYRFLFVSTRTERLQTKWFLLGMAVFILLPELALVIGAGSVFQSFEWGTLSLTILPITLGIAILRYRLWDIDLIIRRTLQYGLLTSLLAFVYFGSVLLGQRLAGALTGSIRIRLWCWWYRPCWSRPCSTPCAIGCRTLSTGASTAASTTPLQTLAAFTQTARDETRLEALEPAILAAVQDSLQPEQAWLWLKEPGRSN